METVIVEFKRPKNKEECKSLDCRKDCIIFSQFTVDFSTCSCWNENRLIHSVATLNEDYAKDLMNNRRH